jgi:hypothetical protein
VLGSIREAIVTVTGSSLVGLYLIGSLAAGDFDADVSDIDLLAVLTDTPGGQLAGRLRRMHADLAQANPRGRGLAACRTTTTTIAVISSGQPFEVIPAEPDWALTMCRGLYAIRYGELRSKPAAAWAQQDLPRWADLIGRALDWRQRQHDPGGPAGTATVAETRAFVRELAGLALE